MSAAARALLALVSAAAAPAAADEAELRVMVFDPQSMHEAWVQMLALGERFEAEHPGVRVTFLPEGGGGDQLAKLKIMLAAREPIDVTWIDVVEFSGFENDGILLDLEPYLASDPTWRPNEFFPGPLDAFRGRDGHLYGLPSTFTPYVMYYNQDLFDELGIPYPTSGWTWDDLLAIARAATRDEDGRRVRWGISITQWLQALAPWIWQNGGAFLSEDGKRCLLGEPAAIEAVGFLEQLFHTERVAATDATYEAQFTRGLFQDGRVALYGPVGYWETYRFKAIDDFRWDVCPLPRGRADATSVALRSYVGIRYTKHPELTYEFLRLLAGPEMAHTLARIGNGVPGLVEVARSEDFLKPDVLPQSEQVFLDVMEHARFLPAHANWREIEATVNEELQGCLTLGRFDAETACHRMATKIDAFLARERAELARPRAPLGWLAAGALALAAAGVGAFLALRGPLPGTYASRTLGASSPRRNEEGARPSGAGHPPRGVDARRREWLRPPWRKNTPARRPGPGTALALAEERSAWRFLALWASGFLLFTLGPMLASLAISLCVWTPVRPLDEARWAGFDNYARMAADGSFWKALQVTSAYSLASVPLSLGLALVLALIVRRGLALFRTLFYLPVLASAVAVGVLWRWILSSDLVEVLIGGRWIESEPYILPGFIAMSLWSVGGPMLVFLAGLQGIDGRLYEAARLDGASRWRCFLHVTLPQLGPVLLFNLVMGVIGAFQTFAQPYVMTQGGPGDASLFFVLYLYRVAFRFHHMGYAAALGWVLFALLLVLTLVLLRQSRRWVHYEGAAS